jgi:hypothetical protein
MILKKPSIHTLFAKAPALLIAERLLPEGYDHPIEQKMIISAQVNNSSATIRRRYALSAKNPALWQTPYRRMPPTETKRPFNSGGAGGRLS